MNMVDVEKPGLRVRVPDSVACCALLTLWLTRLILCTRHFGTGANREAYLYNM